MGGSTLNSRFFPVLMGACAFVSMYFSPSVSSAITLDITMEQAHSALASGRQTMEKAESVEDIASVMKASERAIRAGADPEVDPCGPHAILRTRHYWLEYFGRREAAESKRQKQDIRMPEAKIQEILQMPYLEVEIRLCGEEEFFSEGAEVALQQGTQTIRPVDIGPAERGRKNPGSETSFRSRFTARFAYSDFDPKAEGTFVIFFPDGKLINIPADFSSIQ
ncbi:MAG: hypothetical protein KC563_07385 [Nitrospira sp.]|nr:hypothetical protein [Nitrospira sp.]MCA9475615.1 hypothetical protein [Nitrospira sp.]MCA9480098.1 hypothetical protein [Nitrospira sp.]MCB9710949.1 hypothetical protein [Nitrospiraceae bacterium]HQU27763.1 hypothetical protein [Nitrospirales bacterium]